MVIKERLRTLLGILFRLIPFPTETGLRVFNNPDENSPDRSECIGCGVCEDICPAGVYEMDDVQKKSVMKYRSKCTACTACVVQCPTGAISLITANKIKHCSR